ncbi:MAG: hypothetical protein SGPRY_009053 [Prymnesium sp.]
MQGLQSLHQLRKLSLYYNAIADLAEVALLRHHPSLAVLDMRLNPVTHAGRRYRLAVLTAAPAIRVLDEREVVGAERARAQATSVPDVHDAIVEFEETSESDEDDESVYDAGCDVGTSAPGKPTPEMGCSLSDERTQMLTNGGSGARVDWHVADHISPPSPDDTDTSVSGHTLPVVAGKAVNFEQPQLRIEDAVQPQAEVACTAGSCLTQGRLPSHGSPPHLISNEPNLDLPSADARDQAAEGTLMPTAMEKTAAECRTSESGQRPAMAEKDVSEAALNLFDQFVATQSSIEPSAPARTAQVQHHAEQVNCGYQQQQQCASAGNTAKAAFPGCAVSMQGALGAVHHPVAYVGPTMAAALAAAEERWGAERRALETEEAHTALVHSNAQLLSEIKELKQNHTEEFKLNFDEITAELSRCRAQSQRPCVDAKPNEKHNKLGKRQT